MISINSNGSKWGGETPDGLVELDQRLAQYTLDPMFETCGNFVEVCADGTTSFFGNFYDLSAVFNIRTDEQAVIDRLTSLIRANQASPGYATAKAERKAAAELRESDAQRKEFARSEDRRRMLVRLQRELAA